MAPPLKGTVYYLPGAGGRLATGLGEGLTRRGWSIAGRETVGEFRTLPFSQQVQVIAEDLQQHFWREEARVVAVSFGAYLFLHAQMQMPPFIGRVLLLSPIVGDFGDEATDRYFSPPRPEELRQSIEAGRFKAPDRCEIHVGAEDWQSQPREVQALGQKVGIPVTVVPGRGHMLGEDYVGPVLDRWLTV